MEIFIILKYLLLLQLNTRILTFNLSKNFKTYNYIYSCIRSFTFKQKQKKQKATQQKYINFKNVSTCFSFLSGLIGNSFNGSLLLDTII
jgi:hypothetical protein